MAVALLFGGARTVKYIEVWQTWAFRIRLRCISSSRSLSRLDRWFSAMTGYYYYAVQSAGSTFRTWTPTPFPPPAFGRPVGISVEGEPRADMAHRRFFLWPVNGLPGAVPASFACAAPHVVARFSESDTQPHRRRTHRRLHCVTARLSGYGALSAAAGLPSLEESSHLVSWSSGYLII